MTADALLKAIRSRGSNAETIRDAAHEAAHALQTGLRKPWTRDNIHEAVERLADRHFLGRYFGRMNALLRFELDARAIEMLVCKHFREPYDLDGWAEVCALEAAKAYRVDIGKLVDVIDAIKIASRHRRVRELLLPRVLAIKPKRVRRARTELRP